MYRTLGGSNTADQLAQSEAAREALANFVPPGYEPDSPTVSPDGALHMRYDHRAPIIRDAAVRILQAMDIAGTIDPADVLTLPTTLGVKLRVEPVMESACNLVITGMRGDSHAATGNNFEAVLTLLQRLRDHLPDAVLESPSEPHYAPAPRDEAWLLDIGGSLALLESAGFEVLSKYPATDAFDVQIRRTFHDATTFMAFARSLALPARAPNALAAQPPRHAGGVVKTPETGRQRPWVLIVLVLLALIGLFFYPWQQ